jgi:4-amino-4-deoxy-L-arabinose transferase-like glycosyltransferase
MRLLRAVTRHRALLGAAVLLLVALPLAGAAHAEYQGSSPLDANGPAPLVGGSLMDRYPLDAV